MVDTKKHWNVTIDMKLCISKMLLSGCAGQKAKQAGVGMKVRKELPKLWGEKHVTIFYQVMEEAGARTHVQSQAAVVTSEVWSL